MTTRTTIAILALAALPAVALAQDSTSQGGQRDSARTGGAPSDTSGGMGAGMGAGTSRDTGMSGRTTRTTQGRRTSGGSMNLSRDQVMQLQTALTGAGCDAGTADGVIGPRTRRAITCARQKNNVSSNEELFRSLNLDFQSGGAGAGAAGAGAAPSGVAPSSAAPNSQGMSTDNPAAAATRGDSSQVGGANRGRIYPPADSVRRATSGDTTNPAGTGRDTIMPNRAPGRDSAGRDTTRRP